jgi:hypothetical protein
MVIQPLNRHLSIWQKRTIFNLYFSIVADYNTTRLGQKRFSGWWICRYSPTSSMGYNGSWSSEAQGRPPVDVPQRHVPRCLQQTCSSTQKALLAMVLFWIWQWWRLDISSDVRLGDVGVWRRRPVLASAEKLRDDFIFFYPLGFSLQSVHDNCFLLVYHCLLVSTCVYSYNLIFY